MEVVLEKCWTWNVDDQQACYCSTTINWSASSNTLVVWKKDTALDGWWFLGVGFFVYWLISQTGQFRGVTRAPLLHQRPGPPISPKCHVWIHSTFPCYPSNKADTIELADACCFARAKSQGEVEMLEFQGWRNPTVSQAGRLRTVRTISSAVPLNERNSWQQSSSYLANECRLWQLLFYFSDSPISQNQSQYTHIQARDQRPLLIVISPEFQEVWGDWWKFHLWPWNLPQRSTYLYILIHRKSQSKVQLNVTEKMFMIGIELADKKYI